MTEDDVIYRLGRIYKMRRKIEQKIQTLILDKADDARGGFRGIEEDADELEGEAVAFIANAEGASFEVVYPENPRRSVGLDIDFEGALSTIQIEAEDMSSTANEAGGVLEEMEGEEGDEVQGVVEDYLGTIDTSNEAIYDAVEEIKQGLKETREWTKRDERGVFLRAAKKKLLTKKRRR